jgi:hypothetical protein
MRKALTGLGTWFGPEGVIKEIATFTCAHCNRPHRVEPFCDPADLGGLCKVCMGVICNRQACHDRCDPFEKKLERMEAAGRARRWMEESG